MLKNQSFAINAMTMEITVGPDMSAGASVIVPPQCKKDPCCLAAPSADASMLGCCCSSDCGHAGKCEARVGSTGPARSCSCGYGFRGPLCRAKTNPPGAIYGCTSKVANNYNRFATINDGSCKGIPMTLPPRPAPRPRMAPRPAPPAPRPAPAPPTGVVVVPPAVPPTPAPSGRPAGCSGSGHAAVHAAAPRIGGDDSQDKAEIASLHHEMNWMIVMFVVVGVVGVIAVLGSRKQASPAFITPMLSEQYSIGDDDETPH